MRPIKRIHNSEGYAENSIFFPNYYYFRRDHLGNNREVWLANTDSTVQRTQYYPSGLPWKTNTDDNPDAQPYKYNGKEFIEMHGWDVTDLGWRGVFHAINRFTSIDRFAEKFPWQSPYVHANNNPVRYMDVGGDSVNISGTEQQKAFQETQAYVSKELALTLNNNGTITANQISTGNLSANAQQLIDAINSGTITVNIVTVSGSTNSNGNLIVGGAFEGNVVTVTPNGKIVTATQTINPNVLAKMSNAHGLQGQDVVHEITEAYQGAIISQQLGVSSPASNQQGSVYPQAHNNAVPQSGNVTQQAFTVYGTNVYPLRNGTYLYPIHKVEWSVINTSGERTVIQKIP